MLRWIAPLLSLLLALPLLAAAPPSEGKSDDRAKQLDELKKDLEKTQRELSQALRNAKTDEEREQIRAKWKPAEYAAKAMKIAEADPKDKTGFEALMLAFQLSQGENTKALDLLTEHHAKNPEIKAICVMLFQGGPPGTAKLLEKVLAENPDHDAKGLACLGLANLAEDRIEKDGKKAREEAVKYYERAEKEFADVKIGSGTEGVMAKHALFELKNLQVGLPAPNVVSADLKGMKTELKDLKGKVVVLDIWATWCGPCRAMIPHEREMVEKFKDKPFALISISADDTKETLEKFLEKEKMPWTHWWDGPEGKLVTEWNVKFFPTIYVIDAKGVIRYKHIRGKELEDAVEKLLAEAK